MRKTRSKEGVAAAQAARAISQTNSPKNPVVLHLQRQVANAFVLYANYKRCHWQAHGPTFQSYHQLFDGLAGEVLATLDGFADRLRMIGQDPIASPAEIAERASVAPAAVDTMRAMIEQADEQLLGVIRELREAEKAAEGEDDPGTAELFIRSVQVHERHEWWLRNSLKTDDSSSPARSD
jgi:starvation-inducible DNA-binding protein